MARITVEDCLLQLNNRFQLVMLASQRARDLARGVDESKLDWENDKPTVLALREIADAQISMDYLKKQQAVEPAVMVSSEQPTPNEPAAQPQAADTDQQEASS